MKTQTILLLAAAGVGGLLLWKRVAAPPAATTSPWLTNITGILGGSTNLVNSAKGLWGSITGSTASSGYTVDAVDHQDDTIIPTPVASSSRSIDLSSSSFSHAVPLRNSLGMAS